MIELTLEEAAAVLREAPALNGEGAKFDSLPPVLQAQAVTGLLLLVEALQKAGFRISRPLKEVSST